VPDVVLRTTLVHLHQGERQSGAPWQRLSKGGSKPPNRVLARCWIHAPDCRWHRLNRKFARCKELSDSIFGYCSTGSLRQSARAAKDTLMSPCGDTLSFCHEPGNLVWLQVRRTWCVGILFEMVCGLGGAGSRYDRCRGSGSACSTRHSTLCAPCGCAACSAPETGGAAAGSSTRAGS